MNMKCCVLVVMLFCCGLAFADCKYNGKSYPEGTIIGPYVCKDGKWVDT